MLQVSNQGIRQHFKLPTCSDNSLRRAVDRFFSSTRFASTSSNNVCSVRMRLACNEHSRSTLSSRMPCRTWGNAASTTTTIKSLPAEVVSWLCPCKPQTVDLSSVSVPRVRRAQSSPRLASPPTLLRGQLPTELPSLIRRAQLVRPTVNHNIRKHTRTDAHFDEWQQTNKRRRRR